MRAFVLLILVLTGAVQAAAETATRPAASGVGPTQITLPTVEGETVACHDFRNRVVNFVEVDQLGDAGRAEFIWGSGPVVMTDPELMKTFPVALQVFFKLHECGHHALGHLLAPSGRSEREADCWAIAQGHALGVFDRAAIESWRHYFSTSLGDVNGHLPGPVRVDFLLSCYDDAPGIMARLE